MNGSREETLGRIRRAIGGATSTRDDEYAAIPRTYRTAGELDAAGRLALFVERLEHYQVSVYRSEAGNVAATIDRALAAHGKRRILIPPDLDPRWQTSGIGFVPDLELSYADLDRSEGVLTGCTLGIAFTGSLVLTHRRGEGRRALTLVPDYHLCVVHADQVVETVPEALRRLRELQPRLITTIAGPSATADIEMTRIRGVHGPRTLEVILAAGPTDQESR